SRRRARTPRASPSTTSSSSTSSRSAGRVIRRQGAHPPHRRRKGASASSSSSSRTISTSLGGGQSLSIDSTPPRISMDEEEIRDDPDRNDVRRDAGHHRRAAARGFLGALVRALPGALAGPGGARARRGGPPEGG